MAMYTVEDMSTFSDPEYTVLRDQSSSREVDIKARLSVLDRRVGREFLLRILSLDSSPFLT